MRKRVWTSVSVSASDNGYNVLLDNRPIRTPGRASLVVPTQTLAEAIRVEWESQEDTVDPTSMPMTRAANSAIDKVAIQHREVCDIVAAYGETDLLCYRAEGPPELVARQSSEWDPWLAWSEDELGARLVVGQGVMHVAQPPESLQRLRSLVYQMDSFALTGFHDLVSLSGSLVLGLAVSRGAISTDDAWAVAHLDERWQQELWGVDDEAAQAHAVRRRDFEAAARWLALLSER